MLALVALVSQLATAASGQQLPSQVQGVVRDALGLPMGGVEVVLLGSGGQIGATTSDDGAYRFPSVGSGIYRVRMRKPGFQEWTREISVEPGNAAVADAVLQPSYAETVIVTASRGAESLLTAPAAVSVLGSQQLENTAGDSFADLLRAVPSLNIAQFGARDVNINTRASTGVLSNSMLVLVDGRSFFQPLYGAVYWDLLTVTKDEIAQVEVLRSPASAVWGSNALSGVINLRTKSPRQMEGLSGHVAVGERGTRSVGALWADSTPRFSYKVSGSYFTQRPWDRDNALPDGSPMPPGTLFQNRGARQPKVDARIDWDADPERRWSLRGGVAGAYGLLHSALGPIEFGPGSYYSYLEVDRSGADFDFKAYWNRLDAPFGIVLFGLDEDATNDTFVADLTRRSRAGDRHSLTYGGSLRVDRFDITIAPEDGGRMEGAAFVEDSIRLHAAATVVLGGRVDKFDTTGAVFAPRVAAILSVNPLHSFRISYNRAYRAPSLLENFVNVALPSVVPLDPPFVYFQMSLGSTALEMEKQDAIEVGYTGVLNSHLTVFATVYDQRITNNIWFLPVRFYGPGAPPPGWPGAADAVPLLPRDFSFINLGEVRDRGVELSAHLQWRRFAAQGTYSFQADPDLDSGTDLPLQINRPPQHQLGGGASFTEARWTAAADVHYTDRAFWADVFTEPFWGYTDRFVTVNARASYRLAASPWEVWVSGTNLFDERVKHHVFGDVIRRKITAGARWEWRP